jgi:hypothetical protein
MWVVVLIFIIICFRRYNENLLSVFNFLVPLFWLISGQGFLLRSSIFLWFLITCLIICRPWNPVATKNVDPYLESAIGDCGEIDGIKIGRGNRSTRRKTAPAPLCPPQNPHDQTRAAAVGSQRLTLKLRRGLG